MTMVAASRIGLTKSPTGMTRYGPAAMVGWVWHWPMHLKPLEENPNTGNHIEKGLVHFVNAVSPYQDKSSGHWYQLVSLPSLQGNFLESSCTAMFSYAITKGMQLKILDKKKYMPMVEASYAGLQKMSMRKDANSLVLHKGFRWYLRW